MCTFCQTSDLPSHEKGANRNTNKFISMFLKPNKENEQYRFRLLFYRQERKNDRKDAYIVQKVHDHWGVSAKGTKIVDDVVVCPGTSYVHYDDEKFVTNPKTGKKELNCPICAKFRENMAAYMNSGKTDKISSRKAYQLKSKERLCAPVYVISDPNNEKNNGQFKVLILTNPDDIKLFQKTVDDEKTKAYLAAKNGNGYEVFNGGNAVDLYIRVETVPEVRNQGKPNETVSNVRKITQIAFGRKTQPISAINKEAIDGFEFDDQFYFSNTKAELEAFYKKHYGQNDITPDEEDVFGSNPSVTVEHPKVEPVVENTSASTSGVKVSIDELDDLVAKASEEPVESPVASVETPTASEPSGESEDGMSPEMSQMFAELDI